MGRRVDVLAACNIAKDAFSVASLTLPYIFLSTGLPLASAAVLILGLGSWAGAVVLHTASLAASSTMTPRPTPVSYSHCVQLLWGSRSKIAADVAIVVVDTSASFAMLIAAGQALHSVPSLHAAHSLLATYPALVAAVALAVAAVCIALPSGDSLKYPSALGACAFVALLVLVAVTGAQGELNPPNNNNNNNSNSHRSHVWTRPGQPGSVAAVALAPGVLKFCFAGIESWPSLAVPLGPAYTPTLALAVAIMMSFTMAMGLVGYAYAPSHVAENILLDLPDSIPGNAARITTAAMLTVTTPILLFAAFEILEYAVATQWPSLAASSTHTEGDVTSPLLPPSGEEGGLQRADQQQGVVVPASTSTPVTSVIRLVVVAAAAAAAASFPRLVCAVSVTGAVGDSALGLVVPGAAALTHGSKVTGVALILLGVVCMGCGLVVPFTS